MHHRAHNIVFERRQAVAHVHVAAEAVEAAEDGGPGLRRHAEDGGDSSGSAVDWTVFRPPRLTNGLASSRYRTAVGKPLGHAWTISRATLAAAMLAAAGDPALSRCGHYRQLIRGTASGKYERPAGDDE